MPIIELLRVQVRKIIDHLSNLKPKRRKDLSFQKALYLNFICVNISYNGTVHCSRSQITMERKIWGHYQRRAFINLYVDCYFTMII